MSQFNQNGLDIDIAMSARNYQMQRYGETMVSLVGLCCWQ